ncbi:hypothetical protein ES319_D07G158500v1 [Gossypium barbadense]|uniref:Protein kinase domain-containing protein n=1 Tax=Gossypium barbadense TaxID=3634 RepID=A0A5J5QRD5_GOSBA|nr:hypothetical protein ES319_D07G158500v1 [Gossypium barbadense]
MTSSSCSSTSRNPSFGIRSTLDQFPYSPISSYSVSSSSRKIGSGRNLVTLIARSIVGAFVDCFTPPEPDGYKKVGDSGEIRVPSVAPKASRAKSERRGSNRGIYSNSTKEKGPGSMEFTMEEILKATRNFSPAFKIGQGGFGTVYKGRLDDGTFVAIKRAKQSVYEKHLGVEFQRTLREHLDGVHGKVLDLAARLNIAIDVAHAITYLHTYIDHPIIHRDIKSSNILLTEKLRAKVTDFGFARLAADIDSGATHVSTQVKGTAGYLDPEYLRTYQLTEKSDVYSFGILLVELVKGRRPIEPKREPRERITAKWALKKFNDGDAISALDPRLQQTVGTNLALEKFIIKIENQTIKHFLTNKSLETVPRRIRWYNELCTFNFEVLYVKGTNNIIVDYLSRPYG